VTEEVRFTRLFVVCISYAIAVRYVMYLVVLREIVW
jgi:hypothetical protein